MYISVLSGKGGTGKTTISTNLAVYLAIKGHKVRYLDFDVEEPNGFIFLKPQIIETVDAKVKNPSVDHNLCIGCGQCVKHCNFNALSIVKNEIIIFNKLCHSCGLCNIVCPRNAIYEIDRIIGKIEIGKSNNLEVFRGILNIGEPMAVPIIRQLKKYANENYINIIDSPPGSSCSVVNSVEGSDYSILITEPTKFGQHDLDIAIKVVKLMGIPFGVVINKSNPIDDSIIEEYCKKEKCEIIGKIPFSKEIAVKYSKGELILDESISREMNNIYIGVIGGIENETNSHY